MKNIREYSIVFATIGIVVIILGVLMEGVADNDIYEDRGYRLEVVKLESGNWSYEIVFDQKVYIRQWFVPGVFGNKVFASKSDAERIGKVVLKKLNKGEIPIVTKKDLKDNRISY